MSSEYGLGTESIGVRQNSFQSTHTGLRGPAGSTAPLRSTTQTTIPLYQQNGLRLISGGASSSTFTLTAGSTRDSTNNIDLVLSTNVVFDLGTFTTLSFGIPINIVTVNLAGTISNTGSSIAGVGTAFFTDFGNPANTCFNADYTDQLLKVGGASYTTSPLISVFGGAADKVVTTTSNTAATDQGNITATNSIYSRCGKVTTASGANLDYLVLLTKKDTDDSIGVAVSSFTATGVPDLPAGYTRFRSVGHINIGGTGSSIAFNYTAQPLLPAPATAQGDMAYYDPTKGLQTRLSIGSSGQFLKVSGGIPIWSN